MKRKGSFFFLLLVLFYSCNSDDTPLEVLVSLEESLVGKDFVVDNVIACAASNEDPNVVSIFLYPRSGASNINFYQTENIDVDKNDFDKYVRGKGNLIDVFNGYLLKYEIVPEREKWVIVSFEEEEKIHLSNPIRLKQTSKPTEYLPENVMVQPSNMPIFTWRDGVFDDSKIYFHVVSNGNNNLLSGTYTFDKMFQYYKLDNVVLNITEQEPPTLETDQNYNFTLLAVSEDNWVNLFSVVPFNIQ
ncbi:hypothetical protein MTsPCn9_19730 [Croceitalea sp. MTPC9]|uniref:hypothetical protein n=1 Tax=unclassified Croceitalea TaxID=2632280 RepID=UPI002B3ABCEB|nr:hypothetical protein MTsPCn6_12580 [Croceitalea sp. MTPC6]GMN17037.1 hypothetical protein MTsPCn9_19730 [Croceitalea sp. MTPC9]